MYYQSWTEPMFHITYDTMSIHQRITNHKPDPIIPSYEDEDDWNFNRNESVPCPATTPLAFSTFVLGLSIGVLVSNLI